MKLEPSQYVQDRACKYCKRKGVLRPGRVACSRCESRIRRGWPINRLAQGNVRNPRQPIVQPGYKRSDPPPGDHKSADEPYLREQLAYLRKANHDLECRISELVEAIGRQQEMATEIASAIVAAEPYPRVPVAIPSKPTGRPVTAAVVLSDWHIGEVIEENEVEGFGKYNFAIAQARIFRILDSFIKWIHVQRTGYAIDDLAVITEGDFISGDIHDELIATNEFPVPVQTAKAGLLLGESISRLAAHFNKVIVYAVGADNHSRLQRKPRFKQRYESGLSYLVNHIARCYLEKHENVTFQAATGIKMIASIAGWKFLCEHGDTVKSWMGIPYYGLERSRAREAVKRMGTSSDFNYYVIGHWHVPAIISGNIIVNGSLSGTSEFDHAAGRHARPAQVAFLVSRSHGVFNYVPFSD